MSVKEPAHPLEKRDLLQNEPVQTSRIDAVAAQMAAEGRFPEAIDYIEITHDPKLLAQAEAAALKGGSVWLLLQVDRIRGKSSPAEAWSTLADAARAAERWVDAVRALQLAGRGDEAETLKQEKCPGYDPFKPLGK